MYCTFTECGCEKERVHRVLQIRNYVLFWIRINIQIFKKFYTRESDFQHVPDPTFLFLLHCNCLKTFHDFFKPNKNSGLMIFVKVIIQFRIRTRTRIRNLEFRIWIRHNTSVPYGSGSSTLSYTQYFNLKTCRLSMFQTLLTNKLKKIACTLNRLVIALCQQ
jgi:hypothetical protein